MASFLGSQVNDSYRGTSTADTVTLLGGNDVALGMEGEDVIYAGAGNDNVDGGGGNDFIFGGLGDDNISGGAGNDWLIGGGGDEGDLTQATYLPDGNDALDGGAGVDVLWGMGGDDRLTGGTEADYFIFAAGEGHDVVMDFTKGQDKIDLLNGFEFQHFDTNRNGALDDADVGVTVASGNTVLDFNAYGSPSTLTVIGVTSLAATDFADVL
jgi:Ca2+-binding RTX toxin-like protein